MNIDKDRFKISSYNQKDTGSNYSKTSLSEVNLSDDKLYMKTGKLLKIIDDLKECSVLPLDYDFNFPRVCVVGPPSSGKSSIINSLSGLDLLTRGDNIITRCPIELKMNHIQANNKIRPYCELYLDGYTKEGRYDDISQARKRLTDFLQNSADKNSDTNFYSKDPVIIKYFSNNCANITYIDLPGVSFETNKITKEISYNYIKDDATYILYTINTSDENTQQSILSDNLTNDKLFRFIKESDEDLTRTIGVFTKIDCISSPNSNELLQSLKKLLNESDKEELFKNGFVALKNPSLSDTTSIADNLIIEREYFRSHNAFKFSSNQNLTVESLSEKLKKLFLVDKTIMDKLIFIHKDLKACTQKCQNELSKFGVDYLIYTSESKHTYIASLINIFSDTLEKMFSSKMTQLEDNLMNHKLKEMYAEFLKSYLTNYNPSAKLENEEIIRILKLTEGVDLSGFPEADVIHSLLQDEIEILRDEIKSYLDCVNELVMSVIKNTTFKIFCRFPKLMDKIEELMNSFCDDNFKKMKYIIESVSEMNFNYLYLDEKCLSYNKLLNKFVINNEGDMEHSDHTQGKATSNAYSGVKKHESINENLQNAGNADNYYNGLAEYIKILVNHFYSLMIRNLRECVPKATGKYFLNILKENTRFTLLKELTADILSYESYLEEDPEVMEKRNYFINLMKILKNCDKMLLYDEDIRFVLKGDRRKSINKILEKNLKSNLVSNTSDQNINSNIHDNKEEKLNTESIKNVNTNSNSSRRFFTEESEDATTNISKQSKTSNNTFTSNANNNSSIRLNNNIMNVNNNSIPSKSAMTNSSIRNENNFEKSEKIEKSATTKDSGNFSIKFDPSGDIKDAKVKVDMDAETAWNFYQNNKKYLPTTQQVLSGAKATANFVEKTGNKLNEYDSTDRTVQNEKETIVTGNKIAQPKKMMDPLTMANLFGIKKDASQTAPSKSGNNEKGVKKGIF